MSAKRPSTQYLVISRGQWDPGLTAERIQEAIEAFYAWYDRLAEEGRMQRGHRLARAGKVVSREAIIDGPFAEAKEVIGGYWLIIADSLEEAATLAAQNPCLACGLTYEIRPIEPERASAYKVTNETPDAAAAAPSNPHDGTAQVQMVDMELALDFVSSDVGMDNRVYVSLDSGRIYWISEYAPEEEEVPDDVETSDRYVALPHKRELGLGKDLVLQFAREKLPAHYDEVASIFRSKGAYARFKRFLESEGRLNQWHDFEAQATHEALREWCERHALTIVADTNRSATGT